jgi:hypothetical protein
MRGEARLIEPIVRPIALGMFGFYVFWNVVWIASGKVPASVLQAMTGIPCPTTGCTRSAMALVQGRWIEALCWNPFTLIYVFLFAWSATVLVRQFTRGERLALSPLAGRLWALSLVVGWAAKFLIGPAYW